MDRRQRAVPAEGYCRPVSAGRQAHLVQTHNRSALRRWAQEMGIADKLLELVLFVVREQEGLSTNPKTLRIVCLSEDTQARSGSFFQNPQDKYSMRRDFDLGNIMTYFTLNLEAEAE